MQPDHLPPELNTGLRCVVPACPLRQPYMIFLFVGSSALTEVSFPRNLAIPQLLLSSAWTRLPLAMRGSLTVFPHRGLSPLQFTPMSGAHKSPEPTAVGAVSSAFALTSPALRG